MGGRHGKILNSLGLSRGEPRSRDPTERALFRVRSYSLDSISTAVSLSTTAQIAPSHSSSLDNLHRPWEGGGTSGLQNNIKKESGKKYMPLETSSALSSSTVVCADEQRKSELTQSLPADGERHVALHPHSRSTGMGTGLDGFSDNFVIGTTGEEESRESSDTVQTKSQLHQERCRTEQVVQTIQGLQQAEVTASSLAPAPEIPLGLLQKLSQHEWNQLITFVSSTVEHSLQSAQRQQQQQQQQLPLLQPSTEVRAEREMLEHQKTPGHKKRHRTRKERPKSLPPPYLKQDCERTEGENLEEDAQKDEGVRQRSHSHEDCYHYRCAEPISAGYSCKVSRSSSFRKNYNCRVHRCHCDHRNDSHIPVRRKRSSKSKDAPVDPSLDDNCPGIPENRVRRSRHSRQSICERCLGSLNSERQRQRHARPHSPKEDEGREGTAAENRKDKQGSGDEEEGVDRIGYLTLDKLRTAALLLRRSVGHPEDENLRTREHSGGRDEGGASSSRRRHPKSKTKHTSHEICSVDCVPSQLQPQKLPQKVENSELVFPFKSRTGRDSPATDMAVINLDLNTPHMLAPVDTENTAECLYQQQAYVASNSSLNNAHVVTGTNGSTIQHLYLYNHHHHYHHIIHHSQP